MAERSRNWLKNCFHCSSNESSFVSSLDDIETKSPASLSDEDRKQLDGCILKLKIIETSRLELNPNVMHPFVK